MLRAYIPCTVTSLTFEKCEKECNMLYSNINVLVDSVLKTVQPEKQLASQLINQTSESVSLSTIYAINQSVQQHI